MTQNCGNCVYLNARDSKKCGDWYHGYHEEYYCSELRKYKMPTEGRNCRYYRETSSNSSGGCFITTVVVKLYGLSDNCDILKTLRSFRNDILQQSDEGLLMLKEYDIVGPRIVEEIENDANKDLLSLNLLSNFIIPTVQLVKKYEYDKATEIYSSMVNYLKIKYSVNIKVDEYEYDDDVLNSEKGHGYSRVHKVSVKSE